MNPLVSIVVPCYKLAHYLQVCVNSILEQDYENFEVLIMDNCSPDNTPEVAQSFNDPRVKHIRNESNLGHIRNFNKGITLARGEYVWVISADDLLRSKHVLGRFVEVMERNPGVGFVFCRAVEIHGGKETGVGQWADCGDEDRIWSDRTFFLRLIEANCIVASSVLVRKECYEKVGLFQVDLTFAVDWYMWCMLALHYGVAYLAEPMVCCRFHEESLTTLYSQEYTRICVADQLTILWRLGRQTELASLSSLRIACQAAFLSRAVHLLMADFKKATPSMSVPEFEEILQNRIQDLEGIREIRASVYTNLLERITLSFYDHNACTCAAHDLGVLWGLRNQGKVVGISSLCTACETAFVDRAVYLLAAGFHGATPSMSVPEFEEILQCRIKDSADIKNIRASVYTNLADQQYSGAEYTGAIQSYWVAMVNRPWHLKTWAKYLLLRMGTAGVRIREMSRQLR